MLFPKSHEITEDILAKSRVLKKEETRKRNSIYVEIAEKEYTLFEAPFLAYLSLLQAAKSSQLFPPIDAAQGAQEGAATDSSGQFEPTTV